MDGKEVKQFPSDLHTLEQVEPVYVSMPGWKEDIVGIDHFDGLPENAKTYLQYIANEVDVNISMVSTGPKRSETIVGSNALFQAVH